MSAPQTVEELAKAQTLEYGQFRAVTVITYDGARAYNPGDPVPASNVEAHGYLEDGLVERVPTEAATSLEPADAAPATPATPARKSITPEA